MEAGRVYNFNPGPATLPLEVLKEAQAEFLNFNNSGMSILEISHRAPQYAAVHEKAKQDIKELMGLGDDYEVLFCQGGASQQFAMVPMNLMRNRVADYIVTGQFAKKAWKEAQLFGQANAVASSADKNFTYIPDCSDLPIAENSDYVYICENNTIYGTEIKEDIDCPVPLIADMSSDIMSRPVDVSKYDLIYGGAQKNVGPAGVIFAIIRKDSLGRVSRYLPAMLDYRNHIEKLSMYNTPPVFSIFMMNETLKWLKSIGGVPAIQKINQQKADLLYSEIDRNSLFVGTAAKEDRSLMNVCFVMAPGYEALQDEFLAFAKERGMIGIKGHRSVGGFRASLYNACTVEDVQALVDCMKEFEELKK